MDIKEQKEKIDKIKNIKELNENSNTTEFKETINTNEVARLCNINDSLLKIVEKELKKGKAPSKEILDTIQTSLIITTALPWSKYNI